MEELNKDSKALLDSTIKKFSDLETETTKTITEKTKEADKIFNEKMELVDTESKNLTEKAKEAYDDSLSSIEKKSKDGIKFLEDKKKEASTLLEVISTTSLTGHYKRIANEEGIKANFWRNLAMWVMALIGLVIIAIAWNTKDVSWQDTLFRMTAAFILGFPASYAISESNKHRKNEQRNRRLELELAALDPYLDKLPDPDKIEVKKGFVDQFFGSTKAGVSDEPLPQKELLNLLKSTIQNLTKNK